MVEVLWHGRGGQGAFTAAKILGAAYSLRGNYGLSFPSFGPERRGAPILSFTKLDSKPVGDRSQIKKADYVIFLDDTLFSKKAFEEIKSGGKIILNTKKSYSDFDENFNQHELESLYLFDGRKIALEYLKLPIVNTVMLSILVRESGLLSKEDLIYAIEEYLPSKIAEKNISLIEKVFISEGEIDETVSA